MCVYVSVSVLVKEVVMDKEESLEPRAEEWIEKDPAVSEPLINP
jgi:hypothetical protein